MLGLRVDLAPFYRMASHDTRKFKQILWAGECVVGFTVRMRFEN
jgi:hypothetical protein